MLFDTLKAATHEPSGRAVSLDRPSRRAVQTSLKTAAATHARRRDGPSRLADGACRCSRQQQKFVGKSIVVQCLKGRQVGVSLDPS